jgi:hypothetical protein
MQHVREAAGGALVAAAASTLGDFIWATWIPRHRPVYGLIHGVLLFLCLGLYLGACAGQRVRGAAAGALLGLLAAGGFYALAPITGSWIMFVVWMGAWIGFGVLDGTVLRARAGIRDALVRGTIAALGSAVAFYAVSGIWFPFRPRGLDYAVHFACWTIAYLPGWTALLVGASPAGLRASAPAARSSPPPR